MDKSTNANGQHRNLTGLLSILITALQIGLPVYSFLYLFQILDLIDLKLFTGQHNAIFITVVLIIIFIRVPMRNGLQGKVPWYDFLFASLATISSIYFVINYIRIIETGGAYITLFEQLLGIIMVLMLIEAVRRTMGWTMAIVSLAFFMYAKYCYLFPGFLQGPYISNGKIMNYVYLSNQGIYGTVLGIAATVIVSFLTFGAILNRTGGSDLFIKLSLALLGHVRGGAAKVAIISSCLVGSLSGSPTANVGITGSFTIPLMKRIGFHPIFAGAVEAASSTGGLIMPPMMGAVAFVMADFIGVSYGEIALAALLPAILFFAALYFQVDFYAARNNLVGIPRRELPSIREALSYNWVFFLPIFLLGVLLMVFKYDPVYAVYYSTGLLIILGLLNPNLRFNFKKFISALEDTSLNVIKIAPLCAIAGIIVAAVTMTGIGLNISSIILTISYNNILLIGIYTAIAIYVLGMGVSNIATYILLAVLVAPAMVQAGIPTLSAHFFIIFVGMSMFITPPYAPAAYVASSISGGDPFKTGFQSMKLSIVGYLVPFVSLFNPALFMKAPVWEVLISFSTALLGVYALSIGFEGFKRIKLNTIERVLYLMSGLLLFIPNHILAVPGFILICILSLMSHKHKNICQTETT